MPIGFKRELDRPPLRLAAIFLVVFAIVKLLNLAYLGTSLVPGYYYAQAIVAGILATFVFFGFRWAWGIGFTLFGFYLFRDLAGLFAIWNGSDEVRSADVGIMIFFVVGFVLECLIVGALFISSYRMVRRQTELE